MAVTPCWSTFRSCFSILFQHACSPRKPLLPVTRYPHQGTRLHLCPRSHSFPKLFPIPYAALEHSETARPARHRKRGVSTTCTAPTLPVPFSS